MDINDLIAIVKKKLTDQIDIDSVKIEDKSFLHKKHAGNQEGHVSFKNYFELKRIKEHE
jgi:BolA protein